MNYFLLLSLWTSASIAESAPLLGDENKKLGVLFINDFSLNFVDDGVSVRAKCPFNAYPDAAEQFTFTIAVVDGIDASIDLTLQYNYYQGGAGNHLTNYNFTRTDFAKDATYVFRDFCLDGPEKSDLPTYVHDKLYHSKGADILVLFTAAPAAELAAALPIEYPQFKAVIAVGLKGADATAFYHNTSVTIADFAKPETIACMINAAYTDIQQGKPVDSKTCAKA